MARPLSALRWGEWTAQLWAYGGYAGGRTSAAAPGRMTTPSAAVRVWCMTRRGRIALLRVELGAVAATFLLFSLLHLGVTTELNFIYHRTVLGVVVVSVVVLIVGRASPEMRHRAAR